MKYNFHSKKFIETDVNPNKIAIAGSNRDIDWQTLQDLTLTLSELFYKHGIITGNPVIIYGHKECLFPVAMLACCHNNIPYIPIDKIYPVDRIKKIVEATGAQVLINCSGEHLDITFAITINSELETIISYTPSQHNLTNSQSKDPLQYIMFTSGSTGEPKGVQIAQSSVLTFIDWSLNDFHFTQDDVFMNQAPFSFDVSLCDFLNALTRGATLVLTSTDIIKDQDLFLKRVNHYKCSVWTSTPSFAFLFLRHPDFNSDNLNSLKTFLFMGEELPNRTCKILKDNFKNVRIQNAYGPTEATIITTLVDITDEIIEKYPSLPIGYPMPGSNLLIEKENPGDKDGELIICGDHVSVGYFKNEELNKKKFFIHNGKRAFRTGDLAYYENEMLFYLGRNDDQVKMNGFRIELNEISNVLCKMPFVTDAVTVALKRNKEVKKIISFIIPKSMNETGNIKPELMSTLEKSLPYYMIPGDIVIVKEFPYSTSHKIDKNKLINVYLTDK